MLFFKYILLIIIFIFGYTHVFADNNTGVNVSEADTIWLVSINKPLINVASVTPAEIPIITADSVWKSNIDKPDINYATVTPVEIPVVTADSVWKTNIDKPDINNITVTPVEIPIVVADYIWKTSIDKPDINYVSVTPAEIPIVVADFFWSTDLIKPLDYANSIGDLNNDGYTNLEDIVIILQFCTEIDSQSSIFFKADVNDDKKIDIKEAIYIMKHVGNVDVKP